MPLYAIGDIQGCYDELRALLVRIRFNADADQLWFAGDLVNRGPKSLEVLRFIRDLGANAVTVLGNHDLHLLAAAEGLRRPNPKDTFHDVLAAPDRAELLDWLRTRPLLHRDPERNTVLLHAGLAPQWTVDQAASCAAEIETELRSERYHAFLADMYGDEPSLWSDRLQGMDRMRFALNCLTRLRLCDREGRLRLRARGGAFGRDDGLIPWFAFPGRQSAEATVICGHWSMLGRYRGPGVVALDSGCVWGGALTAVRVEDGAWFEEGCGGYCLPEGE